MALFLLLILPASLALDITLLSNEKLCLGEEVAEQTLIICSFATQKIIDSEKPLHVTILNPSDELVFEKANINEAKFSLTSLVSGSYMFCIENTGNRPSVVVADIDIGAAAKDYNKVASTKDLKPVEIKMRKIADTSA
jgi:hypothetical protein